MMTHLCEYFFQKNLYFNELPRFGQFFKYTLFGSPFLLSRVPIGSPFHSKLGPHWVPIKNILGPHSMWEQCSISKLTGPQRRASFIINSMSGCNILNIAFYLIDWYGFVQDLLLRRSIVRWWPWPYWPHLWENWRGEHKVAFNACRWNENFCRTGILAGEILGAGFWDNESRGGRRGGSAVSLQLACSIIARIQNSEDFHLISKSWYCQ